MSNESSASEDRMNPRTRRVRQVVLDAAIEVLLERGVQDVTAVHVATQADVARSTIYRHWPDQRSLLLATLDALASPHRETPTTGHLDTDVPMVLGLLRTRLTTHDVASIFGALAAYAARDDAFREGQRRLVGHLTRPTTDVLTLAQKQGSLGPDVDCDLEAMLLTAPLLHQHLALHAKIDDELIDTVTRRWLAAQDLA